MTPQARVAILATAVTLFAAGSAGAVPFSRADRNGDGVVDYDEASRAYPSLSEGQFRRMDINRNGVIDRGEYPQLDAIYQLLLRNR